MASKKDTGDNRAYLSLTVNDFLAVFTPICVRKMSCRITTHPFSALASCLGVGKNSSKILIPSKDKQALVALSMFEQRSEPE